MNFQDLNNYPDLQFMPVTAKKIPVIKGWQTLAKKHNLINCEAVGLVCGKLSGNLEVIDIDLKYDITGELYERYKRLISEIDKELLSKLVVQKTQSGGYHFIYRCKKIEGNLKLAQRPITEEERNAEIKELKEKFPNESDEFIFKKVSRVRVLLETRGEGGQIVCFPSKGYELVYGDYGSIDEITEEQRETLHNIARQFNEVFEEQRPVHFENKRQVKGVSPFEDYNNRGDVLFLLQNHGWKIINRKGDKTFLLRPGCTTSQTSGNFDHSKNWFSVFTTSTEFEPTKAYLPYAVYTVLEHKGNYSEAAKKLYEDGYGDRREVERENNTKIPSRISLIDDDYSFVAKPEDYEEYLTQVREGRLPMGLTTGMQELDKYFLFKQGNLVIINGVDNVGKTKIILFLCILSSLHHGWKWIIYASENTIGSIMRTLIEFYVDNKLNKINDIEYNTGRKFVESHFTIIKSEESLYNYRDIINMTKKLLKRSSYNSVLIDPYNSLKIELNNSSKLSTHEFHYEAISEIKFFGKRENIGFYINMHAVTSAIRQKDADGYAAAPNKEDTEGGGKFANKADEFLTIHRRTQHPTEWMISDIFVRKVKEIETGGRPTPLNTPVRLKMNQTGIGFSEWLPHGLGDNPIQIWKSKQGHQREINYEPSLWMPYKDNDGKEISF